MEFKVDAIVFFKVVDARKTIFNVNDYVKSLQLTIRSILRDEIGRINLEEVYCSRATVSRNLEKEAKTPDILTNYLQLHNAEKISENLGQGKATTVFLPGDMKMLIRGFNIFNEVEPGEEKK